MQTSQTGFSFDFLRPHLDNYDIWWAPDELEIYDADFWAKKIEQYNRDLQKAFSQQNDSDLKQQGLRFFSGPFQQNDEDLTNLIFFVDDDEDNGEGDMRPKWVDGLLRNSIETQVLSQEIGLVSLSRPGGLDILPEEKFTKIRDFVAKYANVLPFMRDRASQVTSFTMQKNAPEAVFDKIGNRFRNLQMRDIDAYPFVDLEAQECLKMRENLQKIKYDDLILMFPFQVPLLYSADAGAGAGNKVRRADLSEWSAGTVSSILVFAAAAEMINHETLYPFAGLPLLTAYPFSAGEIFVECVSDFAIRLFLKQNDTGGGDLRVEELRFEKYHFFFDEILDFADVRSLLWQGSISGGEIFFFAEKSLKFKIDFDDCDGDECRKSLWTSDQRPNTEEDESNNVVRLVSHVSVFSNPKNVTAGPAAKEFRGCYGICFPNFRLHVEEDQKKEEDQLGTNTDEYQQQRDAFFSKVSYYVLWIFALFSPDSSLEGNAFFDDYLKRFSFRCTSAVIELFVKDFFTVLVTANVYEDITLFRMKSLRSIDGLSFATIDDLFEEAFDFTGQEDTLTEDQKSVFQMRGSGIELLFRLLFYTGNEPLYDKFCLDFYWNNYVTFAKDGSFELPLKVSLKNVAQDAGLQNLGASLHSSPSTWSGDDNRNSLMRFAKNFSGVGVEFPFLIQKNCCKRVFENVEIAGEKKLVVAEEIVKFLAEDAQISVCATIFRLLCVVYEVFESSDMWIELLTQADALIFMQVDLMDKAKEFFDKAKKPLFVDSSFTAAAKVEGAAEEAKSFFDVTILRREAMTYLVKKMNKAVAKKKGRKAVRKPGVLLEKTPLPQKSAAPKRALSKEEEETQVKRLVVESGQEPSTSTDAPPPPPPPEEEEVTGQELVPVSDQTFPKQVVDVSVSQPIVPGAVAEPETVPIIEEVVSEEQGVPQLQIVRVTEEPVSQEPSLQIVPVVPQPVAGDLAQEPSLQIDPLVPLVPLVRLVPQPGAGDLAQERSLQIVPVVAQPIAGDPATLQVARVGQEEQRRVPLDEEPSTLQVVPFVTERQVARVGQEEQREIPFVTEPPDEEESQELVLVEQEEQEQQQQLPGQEPLFVNLVSDLNLFVSTDRPMSFIRITFSEERKSCFFEAIPTKKIPPWKNSRSGWSNNWVRDAHPSFVFVAKVVALLTMFPRIPSNVRGLSDFFSIVYDQDIFELKETVDEDKLDKIFGIIAITISDSAFFRRARFNESVENATDVEQFLAQARENYGQFLVGQDLKNLRDLWILPERDLPIVRDARLMALPKIVAAGMQTKTDENKLKNLIELWNMRKRYRNDDVVPKGMCFVKDRVDERQMYVSLDRYRSDKQDDRFAMLTVRNERNLRREKDFTLSLAGVIGLVSFESEQIEELFEEQERVTREGKRDPRKRFANLFQCMQKFSEDSLIELCVLSLQIESEYPAKSKGGFLWNSGAMPTVVLNNCWNLFPKFATKMHFVVSFPVWPRPATAATHRLVSDEDDDDDDDDDDDEQRKEIFSDVQDVVFFCKDFVANFVLSLNPALAKSAVISGLDGEESEIVFKHRSYARYLANSSRFVRIRRLKDEMEPNLLAKITGETKKKSKKDRKSVV